MALTWVTIYLYIHIHLLMAFNVKMSSKSDMRIKSILRDLTDKQAEQFDKWNVNEEVMVRCVEKILLEEKQKNKKRIFIFLMTHFDTFSSVALLSN